jgi:hypothetical protein
MNLLLGRLAASLEKITKKSINVVLFLDNASCHPKVTLSKMKIAWFPANATSVSHPTDMGVTYTFKPHYRQFLMQFFILNVEEADNSYTFARSVSDLDPVNWIRLAIKKIKARTVK